jgi:SAM-dependent methyltransferase
VSDSELTAARWDAEYRNRRYADDPPLPFVERIVDTLRAEASAAGGTGLYVGCGNGRNYLPLVDAGLDVLGLDVSPEAIARLADRRPALAAQRLVCADFRDFTPAGPRVDFVIAIQVFQHGDDTDVGNYFARVAALLRPGGLFFLRVNSASTQVYHAHTVVERNALGGFTVRYDDGPKRGLLIHFFSHAELWTRLEPAFTLVMAPAEDVTLRTPPKTGSWAQWESIWRRR